MGAKVIYLDFESYGTSLISFCRLDLETEDVRVLGAHEAPVSSVVYDHETSQY